MKKKLAPAALLALLILPGRSSAEFDLDAVRRSVDGAGKPFTVGETSMTRLSAQERQGRVLPSYPFPDGFALVSAVAGEDNLGGAALWSNAALPRFTWQDLDGASYLTAVKEQGGCNSCFVFASLAAVEAQHRYVRGDASFDIDLSEQEVVSCIYPRDSCSTGGAAEQVGFHLQTIGVPDEACLPYSSGVSGEEGSCEAVCADADARRHFIGGFAMSVVPWTTERIKQELLQAPVIANLQIYDELYAYTGGVYRRTSDQPRGWHVVLIVGWDDSDSSWIVKNSWGEDWGMQGFLKISRDEQGCLPSWPLGTFHGTCLASHTTVYRVGEGDVLVETTTDAGFPESPDAGSPHTPDASEAEPEEPEDVGLAVVDAAEPESDPDPDPDPDPAPDAGIPSGEPDAAQPAQGGDASTPDPATADAHEAELGCRAMRAAPAVPLWVLVLVAWLWLHRREASHRRAQR